MRALRTLAPAVLLAACLVPLGAGSSSAAPPTCRGETATIVGTPGGTVSGTEARDVVVSNRAASVKTLGGDDLVCVTGARSARVEVDTWVGDDEVHVLGGVADPRRAGRGRGHLRRREAAGRRVRRRVLGLPL